MEQTRREGILRRRAGGPARRPARLLAAIAAAACCALPTAGCGLFGAGAALTNPSVMTVNSGAFSGNIMPVRFTCGVRHAPSPPLSWAGVPVGTKSIALVVDDSNAPIAPYVYWLVFDISPATSDIQEGQLPPGARQAQGSNGVAAYNPPCPGSSSHQYRFTVYALNRVLNLPAGTSLKSAWTQIAASTIGRGRRSPYATS